MLLGVEIHTGPDVSTHRNRYRMLYIPDISTRMYEYVPNVSTRRNTYRILVRVGIGTECEYAYEYIPDADLQNTHRKL